MQWRFRFIGSKLDKFVLITRVYHYEDPFAIAQATMSISHSHKQTETPNANVSVTCTLYKGAPAPRHPRQRDFRRKSKQRGRPTRTK